MRIHLKREFFTDREYVLAENGAMKATAFRYSTGIEALKVENKKGYFIIFVQIIPNNICKCINISIG